MNSASQETIAASASPRLDVQTVRLDESMPFRDQLAGDSRPHAAASCCAPVEQASCCEPAEKSACCGAATGTGCGCR